MAAEFRNKDGLAKSQSVPDELLNGLDPGFVQIQNQHGRHKLRADEVSIEEYRQKPLDYNFSYPIWKGQTVYHEEEIEVPVIKPEGLVKVRIYTPESQGPSAVHLNYHGGGWVLGNLETEAAQCRSVCNNVGIGLK